MTNRWHSQIFYRVDSDCAGATALSACDGVLDGPHRLQVGSQPAELLLISTGAPINSVARGSMQVRESSSDLIEYLDTPELLDAIDHYPLTRPGEQSNDQILFVAQPPL